MQLAEIIEYWSFWDKEIPLSIPRKVSYPSHLDPKSVLAIQGVRRCGKSTLLTQILKHYGLNPKKCLFVNFEDPRLVDALSVQTLDEVVAYFSKTVGRDEAIYFFFDEIQNIPHWHGWLHSKIERPTNAHFIVTGSNANLLSKELGSKLTGRHTAITLYPFTFEELQKFDKSFSLERYLQVGGFPAAFNHEDSGRVLRQYFADIIEKDILARLGINNPQNLKQLAKIIFESAGSECSLRKLAGTTGLSSDTVASYIDHFEAAYLILSCPYFTYSAKQRIRRNNKYYPIDPALRSSVVTRTGQDLGKSFEIVLFLALKQICEEVCYWKGKGEVDFVVKNSKGIWPIQASIETHKDRHLKALQEFYSEFPEANPEILCTPENFQEVLNSLSN